MLPSNKSVKQHGLNLKYDIFIIFTIKVPRIFFQTAVSLAYGLGPLIGGYLVEVVGFPNIMRTVGVMNILYVPLLILLKVKFVTQIFDV